MWHVNSPKEHDALSQLQGQHGFTISPGVHVVRFILPNLSTRYRVLVFMSADQDEPFLSPKISTFKEVRREIYKNAKETDPHLIGPLLTLCSFCLSPTTKKCSECGLAYYCDRTCAISDRRQHRDFCRGIAHSIGTFFGFDLLQ